MEAAALDGLAALLGGQHQVDRFARSHPAFGGEFADRIGVRHGRVQAQTPLHIQLICYVDQSRRRVALTSAAAMTAIMITTAPMKNDRLPISPVRERPGFR